MAICAIMTMPPFSAAEIRNSTTICRCSHSATAGRQRQDENTGIAQASKFTANAGRNRIKKMAGPTCLPAEHALQIIHRISKQKFRQQLVADGKSSEPAFRPEEYACRSMSAKRFNGLRRGPADHAASARRDRSGDISPRSSRADLARRQNRPRCASTRTRAKSFQRRRAPERR
jgi:hypothetical protein